MRMQSTQKFSAEWFPGKRYPDYGYKVSTDNQFYDIFARIWGWDGRRSAPQKAVKQLNELVSQKIKPTDRELKFFLGVAYLSGWILCKRPEAKAARLFEKTAGYFRSMMALGYFYERGLGGYPKDPDAMLAWYCKAAKYEYSPARYRLAVIELISKGPNLRSTRLLRQAAKAGYEPAEELLEQLKDRQKWEQEDLEACLPIDKESAIWDFSPKCTYQERYGEEDTAEDIQSDSTVDVEQMKDDLIRELSARIREMEDQLVRLQQEIKRLIDTVPVSEKENEEKFLSVLFKDKWRNPEGLSEESCDALVDARTLMKTADRLGIKNYAGIVITAVSSLEIETRRRFFDLYIEYLKAQGKKEAQYPTSLLYNRDRDGELYYTLGSFWHIVKNVSDSVFDSFLRETLLSESAKRTVSDMQYQYAGEIIRDYEFPNIGKTFADIVCHVKSDYRNEAAHGHSMSREQAATCCDILGITGSEDAHAQLNEIEGALQALLWLTAPLE